MITLGIEMIKAVIIKLRIPITNPNNTTRQKFENVKLKPSEIASPKPFDVENIYIKVSPKIAVIVKLKPYCTSIPKSGIKAKTAEIIK